MYVANILAGGSGSRMDKDLPKQFVELDGKPILIYTLEKFIPIKELELIIVAAPSEYLKLCSELVDKHFSNNKIVVCEGGKDRTGSIINSIKAAEIELNTLDFTIVTHDSARPLVDERIIRDNIIHSKGGDVINTAIESHDTIIESIDSNTVSNITNRNNMYLVQTPQTFKAKEYLDLIDKTDEKYTDACSLFVANNKQVRIIKGSKINMKLTTKDDLLIAESLLKKVGN